MGEWQANVRRVLIENGLEAMAESQLMRPERMTADIGSTGTRMDHNGDSLNIPISALDRVLTPYLFSVSLQCYLQSCSADAS